MMLRDSNDSFNVGRQCFHGTDVAKDPVSTVETIIVEFFDRERQHVRTALRVNGCFDRTILPLREIISIALSTNAYAIRLTHNHPSGDSKPSLADIKATRQAVQILSPIGIRVDDHIIIGANDYFSFREAGLL